MGGESPDAVDVSQPAFQPDEVSVMSHAIEEGSSVANRGGEWIHPSNVGVGKELVEVEAMEPVVLLVVLMDAQDTKIGGEERVSSSSLETTSPTLKSSVGLAGQTGGCCTLYGAA